jgi:cell division protein FtsB
MSSAVPTPRTRMPRIAEAALERARLTVVPRRRVRTSTVPFMILVSMVLVGGVVGLLLFNTSMQQASFATRSLEDQAANLSAHEQTLRMELDRLNNPQVVAMRAQRMGMVLPTSPAFLRLSDGKVIGQPAPGLKVNTLRLQPPAPVKPAALAPQPHVTIVHVKAPPTSGHKSSGNTSSGSRQHRSSGGRTVQNQPAHSAHH